MQYRNLGKSGLKVSGIGLGGTNFAEKLNEQDSISVIKHALDSGINFIDTANKYGEGKSEEFIGKAIKGHREQVVIGTKCGLPMFDCPNDGGNSRYNIINSVNASLKRLDTDYIDLYYLHWPDEETPIEETLFTLDSLVRAGKIRYIGASNFRSWELCEAVWISRVNHLEPFAVCECRYNILTRDIEMEISSFCEKYGIGIIPWAPLGGGFLTGKFAKGTPMPARPPAEKIPESGGKRVAELPPMPSWYRMSNPFSDANYDKLEKLKIYAADHGHTVEELSLAWLLGHKYVSSIIAGAKNNQQVDAHVKAADWKLTAQEMAEIEELISDVPPMPGMPHSPSK